MCNRCVVCVLLFSSILIKHGFDVNRVLPGAHGTCLHEAALYGKIEAVHYLLQCGANPSIKNTQGLTPLDIVNHYTDPRSAQQLKQLLKGVWTCYTIVMIYLPTSPSLLSLPPSLPVSLPLPPSLLSLPLSLSLPLPLSH